MTEIPLTEEKQPPAAPARPTQTPSPDPVERRRPLLRPNYVPKPTPKARGVCEVCGAGPLQGHRSKVCLQDDVDALGEVLDLA
jgi:hypothetical protein